MLAYFEDLNLTEAILLLGLVAVVVNKILEASGKTRTSKILREENGDLTNRIRTLEKEKVERVEHEVRLTARIESLEEKVKDLETRDQAAVLQALTEVENKATNRHEEAMSIWERIAQASEHKEQP